jgi:signal transduction histidine kinase
MSSRDRSDVAATGSAGRRPGLIQRALGLAGLQARAVFRVLAAVAVGSLLLVNASRNEAIAATVVPVLAGLYVLVSTALSWPRDGRARRPRVDVLRAVLDTTAVCAVALAVREPRVAVLLVLCAIPLGYGLTLTASSVVGLTATAVAGCLVVWATGPVLGAQGIGDASLVLLAFAITWCGLVAGLIALERERRAARIARLSASVRDMLHQTLRAEANERTRVADLLHDDVLQLLLTTRHDITDAIDGDLDLLPDARAGLEAATRRLRETIVALREEGDDNLPLGEALSALSVDPVDGRGTRVAVEVERSVGALQNPVLAAAARDLVREAEGPSAARAVAIDLRREEQHVVLVVRHEDRRFDLGLKLPAGAADTLNDVAARIHALDGSLDVDHGPDGERVITIRVPVLAGRQPLAPDAVLDFPGPAYDVTHRIH